MKNLIIVFLFAFLLLPSALLSQYSLPIRLVTSAGAPHTGQAGNITFTRYPHVHGVDNVIGLTITEIGTAGNYRCKGFTTYEYVKLWLSGVEQTWFDSVQVGNIASWLNTIYPRLAASNTYTGLNSFTNDVGFSDNVDITAGNTTIYHPLLGSSSDWLTDYSLLSTRSLIFKASGDSLYGLKKWFLDGSDKIRLESGWKLYGRTNTVSPINLNTSHFSYSSDQLSLNTAIFNVDSVKHKIITIGKDTTWTVMGEPVTKWRFISIKKGFWHNAYSIPDWKVVYESFDESGTLVATDSTMLINEVTSVDNATSVSCSYDGTYQKVDSLLLPAGKYQINFSLMWQRPDHNDVSQIGVSDTLGVALKEQSTAPNVYIVDDIRHIETYVLTNNFSGGVLGWSTIHTVAGAPKYIYLYGFYFGTTLSNAIGSGATALVTRGSITATLIR